MASMMEKFKNFLTGGDYETDYQDYNDEYTSFEEQDDYQDTSWNVQSSYEEPQPIIEEPAPAVKTPVYLQPTSTVVMLSPYDIRTSQIVCDHIREGHIVICNLTASSNNQRVVDYISGGVYAFDGKIEPTAVKTTFVCTPKNVNLIVDANEASESISGTKVSAL